MGYFNDRATLPLATSLRRYSVPLLLMAAEPFAAMFLGNWLPNVAYMRAATAIPALLIGLWPAAFGAAPSSYWLIECACWFMSGLAVLALFAGGSAIAA